MSAGLPFCWLCLTGNHCPTLANLDLGSDQLRNIRTHIELFNSLMLSIQNGVTILPLLGGVPVYDEELHIKDLERWIRSLARRYQESNSHSRCLSQASQSSTLEPNSHGLPLPVSMLCKFGPGVSTHLPHPSPRTEQSSLS